MHGAYFVSFLSYVSILAQIIFYPISQKEVTYHLTDILGFVVLEIMGEMVLVNFL